MVKILIVDGYIDEPSCLGVPPYISPYPRYIFGAILAAEATASIRYMTIDQLRATSSRYVFLSQFDAIVIIAGMVVPGRYLSGYPMSPREVIDFFRNVTHPVKILCGPAARYGFGLAGGKLTQSPKELQEIFDVVVTGDSDIVINQLVKENLQTEMVDPQLCQESFDTLAHYSVVGSHVVTQHPNFPEYILAEIETFRGCPRSIVNGCSFCSEPSKGPPRFRKIKDIVHEIEALYNLGIRHYRLGNQPCFFSYQAIDAGKEEFPRPNPSAIEKLMRGIRAVTPGLKTLHIDN
ncbi:MAG: radical SAM protein, partial [Candidatus Heimdallarchaeota archaeon]|nr:radical SAM protein [Candidatus Heimdallarchaeota archaeon]